MVPSSTEGDLKMTVVTAPGYPLYGSDHLLKDDACFAKGRCIIRFFIGRIMFASVIVAAGGKRKT
jgi:hypothetical protein